MANDTVIRAESLGKKYILGPQKEQQGTTFRESMSEGIQSFARRVGNMVGGKPVGAKHEPEEFWALREVNFDIKKGDVVGIIGRNGAGKSTLLKVLSRITEPSEGRVEIKGRVASLLEVGTGFHPELSGRENIFLNGAILGMSHAEIGRKFSEIVDFSGVEKFLDTPVKRYSSGMYVRLAFAVAAHLEPEILVVDEVLAVGDAEFQKKCLGKMQDVSTEGRTVFFVSHNMAAIRTLCKDTLLMSNGSLLAHTNTSDALEMYMNSSNLLGEDREWGTFSSNKPTYIASCKLELAETPAKLSLQVGLRFKVDSDIDSVLNVFILDYLGQPVGAYSVGGMGSISYLKLRASLTDVSISFDLPRLAQGRYFLKLQLCDIYKNIIHEIDEACFFDTAPQPNEGEAEALASSWGYGSIWPQVNELTVKSEMWE